MKIHAEVWREEGVWCSGKTKKRPAWLHPKEEEEKESGEGAEVSRGQVPWELVIHVTPSFKFLALP